MTDAREMCLGAVTPHFTTDSTPKFEVQAGDNTANFDVAGG